MHEDLTHHLLSIEGKVDRLLHAVHGIERKVDKLMTLATDLKAAIAAIDAETTIIGVQSTKIGELIISLANRITNGMSDAEVADVKAAMNAAGTHLTAEGDRLTTLAVDPTQPVPPVPTPLAQARAKIKP